MLSCCIPPDLKDDPRAEKILAASKETFLEMGYAAASMDIVAHRARVSKTTLYTRFPSKEALFAATMGVECERHGMAFQPDEFNETPLEEILYVVGRRFVDLIWSPAALRVFQIVVGEAARFPELARIYHENGPLRACRMMTEIFERRAEQGRLSIDDPTFAAEQFLASFGSRIDIELRLGLRPVPSEAEREDFVRRTVRLFINGLRRAPD